MLSVGPFGSPPLVPALLLAEFPLLVLALLKRKKKRKETLRSFPPNSLQGDRQRKRKKEEREKKNHKREKRKEKRGPKLRPPPRRRRRLDAFFPRMYAPHSPSYRYSPYKVFRAVMFLGREPGFPARVSSRLVRSSGVV